MKKIALKRLSLILLIFLISTQASQAAHRALLFNQFAMDKVLEMWPDLVESVNNQARGMENPRREGSDYTKSLAIASGAITQGAADTRAIR